MPESALTFEVHRDVASLADEWDNLADRLGAVPFLRPGWFTAWYRAFAVGQIEILAARRGERLVAVAPLERGRVSLRSATNWHTPVWAPLVEDADALAALAGAMVERARPWLSLGFVDAGTSVLERLREATGRCRTRVYPLERSPFIRLLGSWDEYERRLTAKRRSNLRRMWRRMAEHGEVELQISEGDGDLRALLEEGFRVEASSWKGEQGTAINSAPETHTFYEEVGFWAARRGSLRLAFLNVGGQAVAFDFAIEEQGAHSLLKTGYDAAWRSFAPGVLLRQRMIERAFEQGLDTYEFLGDAVEWKQEWTDSVRERVALEAFGPTVAGTVGWATWAYARPAVRRLAAAFRRP
jgi:CelD/BcsL family acetyltransferase involved in cellulose biosynthesis